MDLGRDLLEWKALSGLGEFDLRGKVCDSEQWSIL